MCMFCAAIPVVAASSVALDSQQRRKRQAKGFSPQRVRPILLLTVLVVLLLMLASAYVHIKFPRYF